jgi:integrase
MAKKLNQHIYQDTASGVWYFQKKARGVTKPYKFSLETKSVVEARRKRDDYLKQIDLHGRIIKEESAPASESFPFGEVAKKWAEIVKPYLAETTFEKYRAVMNSYVLPHFGNKTADSITGLDIETFVSALKCGGKTKQNILTPFRLVMKFAKRHKLIESNPFVDVEPIRKTKSERKRPLNVEEISRFIDTLDDFWRPLFIFLFFTGVRIAEATALKWKRVDFRNRTVQIHRNLVRGKGGKTIYKKTKTESSTREIEVLGFVLEALREQRKRTWKGDGEGFVFLNKAGRPIHRHTLNNTVIKPVLEKIGVATPISVKDTRASFITNALNENERMSFIQKQVGHTTTRMIVDHYYRHVPAPSDGARLERAWNSTRILPESERSDLQFTEKITK